MQVRGRVEDIYYQPDESRVVIMLSCEDNIDSAELLRYREKNQLCDIEVKKHSERRSLNANAYAWVLMDKIAKAIQTDKWEVYLECLKSYGQFDVVTVSPEAVESFCSRWRECVVLGNVTVDGVTGVQIQAYYGSSTYTTAEMARFIDGVISEANFLGIPTATPKEVERMKKQWGR